MALLKMQETEGFDRNIFLKVNQIAEFFLAVLSKKCGKTVGVSNINNLQIYIL